MLGDFTDSTPSCSSGHYVKRSSQELKGDIERPVRPTKTSKFESSVVRRNGSSLSVSLKDLVPSTIRNFKSLCGLIKKRLKDAGNQVLTEPIFVGKVSSPSVWDEYSEYDRPPLHPKYCLFLEDTLDVVIVELPHHIHEFFAMEILCQLRDQSKFVVSGGSATVSHNQADQFISPSNLTPGFGGLPANTSWPSYATLIIEVGVSQDWGGIAGLDKKAQKWFDCLNSHGLQYILCVKISKTRGLTSALGYKLYDVPNLRGVFPDPAPNPTTFTEAAVATVNLDARRLLGIPPNCQLPQGAVDPFTVNLAHIRDCAAVRGF